MTDPTAAGGIEVGHQLLTGGYPRSIRVIPDYSYCLLYTSDAADERSSVDLGGRRIIKKNTHTVDDPLV